MKIHVWKKSDVKKNWEKCVDLLIASFLAVKMKETRVQEICNAQKEITTLFSILINNKLDERARSF